MPPGGPDLPAQCTGMSGRGRCPWLRSGGSQMPRGPAPTAHRPPRSRRPGPARSAPTDRPRHVPGRLPPLPGRSIPACPALTPGSAGCAWLRGPPAGRADTQHPAGTGPTRPSHILERRSQRRPGGATSEISLCKRQWLEPEAAQPRARQQIPAAGGRDTAGGARTAPMVEAATAGQNWAGSPGRVAAKHVPAGAGLGLAESAAWACCPGDTDTRSRAGRAHTAPARR